MKKKRIQPSRRLPDIRSGKLTTASTDELSSKAWNWLGSQSNKDVLIDEFLAGATPELATWARHHGRTLAMWIWNKKGRPE